MKKKTVKDIPDLKNKTVLMTADFNISLYNGKISNDRRIKEALPTIEYLHRKGAKIVLISHLGRPVGIQKELSLLPVARRLSRLTEKKVNLIENYWQKDTKAKIEKTPFDELVLLENIRFFSGEEVNDRKFARHLSSFAQYFVNDAFGKSHRVHASTVGVAEFLPAFAGLLMAKEIEVISNALENPERPMTVFIGGAKTPEKISVIENMLDLADTIALGGAVANTFLAAWGFGMGNSLVDHEMIEMARVVFWKVTKKHAALLVPHDVIISDSERKMKPKTVRYTDVPANVCIYDIGPNTLAYYCEQVKKSKTVIWNGPMGYYEDPRFKKGSDTLLKAISRSTATSIIGGGDTLTSIHSKQLLKNITHVSTGGSAILAFLGKGTLPGIDVLQDA